MPRFVDAVELVKNDEWIERQMWTVDRLNLHQITRYTFRAK